MTHGPRHTSNVINGFFWIRQLTIVHAAAVRTGEWAHHQYEWAHHQYEWHTYILI
jgi:hypothetical protein